MISGEQSPKVVELDGARQERHRRALPGRSSLKQGSGKTLFYDEVIALVERLVAERNLAPGDLLPTQIELAELAGVSLITVRRALEELERAGRVRRHQGVGTFLAGSKIVTESGRSGGLLDTLMRDHQRPRVGTRIIGLERGVPSANLAATLRLADDAEAWRLRRERLVDGRPTIIETAVIPVLLAPGLDRFQDRLTGSLYDLLAEQYGLEDDHEEQYLEVAVATAPERRLLGLAANSQVVRLRGVSVTREDVPFDCFHQVYPAGEFVFYISGGTSKRLLSSPEPGEWDMRPVERASEHREGVDDGRPSG